MRQFCKMAALTTLVAGVYLNAPAPLMAFDDCNSNSVDDATDIALGTSEDCI